MVAKNGMTKTFGMAVEQYIRVEGYNGWTRNEQIDFLENDHMFQDAYTRLAGVMAFGLYNNQIGEDLFMDVDKTELVKISLVTSRMPDLTGGQ